MHKQKLTKYEITFAQKWRIWGLWLTTELTIMGDDNERLAAHTQQKLTQVTPPHPPRAPRIVYTIHEFYFLSFLKKHSQ